MAFLGLPEGSEACPFLACFEGFWTSFGEIWAHIGLMSTLLLATTTCDGIPLINYFGGKLQSFCYNKEVGRVVFNSIIEKKCVYICTNK